MSLQKLCQEYGIAGMYAFGSRAAEIRAIVDGTGQVDPVITSDADIAVRMLPGVTLPIRKKVELVIELEKVFGFEKVDLNMLSEADPFLAANVIRGERIYSVDETDADEYDLYVLRRAGDLAPFERERIENVLNRQEASP